MKIGRLNRASFAKTARRVMLLFAFAALGAQAATVATVNGTGYETLEAAIAAAEPGSTVAVCEDIRQDKTLTIQEKDLTLDLNGKTLTVATEGDGIVVQDATLNLGNSGGTGKYVFECSASGSDGIYLHNTREDGGSILNINGNVEILFKPGVNSAIHAYGEAGKAVVNMNAGNVYAGGKGQRVSAIIIDQNAAFNMKGGTFDLDVDFDTFSQNNNDVVGVLVWGQNGVQKNGTVKIEGGSFNVGGKNAFAQIVQVGMKNGKSDNVSVEISGGEIVLSPSGDGEGYVFTPYNAAYASATMSGGRIRGTVTALTATASGADTANMIVSGGTFPFEVKESYCADGFTVKATTDANGNTVYGVVEAAFVTVTGIAGFADRKFASFAEAYAAIKPTIEGLGLGEESATADAFDALFTSVDENGNATLTYTISGTVVYDETACANLLTMGRKASHYGNGRHLINFKFVGATGKEADTLTVNSNITLPYEWWGEKTTTGIHFENLTITGSAPNGLYPSQSFFEGIDFSVSRCALKGIKIYNCSNVEGSYTITDSVLDGTGAPADSYAIHLQGNETAPLSINIKGNTISGYDRGINIDQKTAVATIKGNTISVKDTGRSCIQLTRLATAGIVGNTLALTGGNAITLHKSLLGLSPAPEVSISGNNVTGKGYLIYDDAVASGTAFTSDSLKLTYATDNVVAETVNTTQGVKGTTTYGISTAVKNEVQHYVAQVGTTGYITLAAALADVAEGAPLTWVSEGAWPVETPVYYNGTFYETGTGSAAKGALERAIDAANAANAAAVAKIYVRPGYATANGLVVNAHQNIKTSIAIFGNNASLSLGLTGWEPCVEYPGENYHTLTKDVSIEIYNLHDGAGVWGQRLTTFTVTVTMADCRNVHEVLLNGQYATAAASQNNFTIRRCTFDGENGAAICPVTTTSAGKVVVEGCAFANLDTNYVVNMNNKNGGTTEVSVKDCSFRNCGATGKEVVRLTGEAEGSTVVAELDKLTFDEASAANAIIVGNKKTENNKASVSYTITRTSGTMNVYKQGVTTAETTTLDATAEQPYTGSNVAENDGSEAHPYSREQFAAMTRADYIAAQARLGGTLYVNVGNYAYETAGVLGNGVRNDTPGQVPDHSKLNAYGENGYLGEENDGANGHAVVFVGGTITSGATGYTSIDNIGTSLLLAVPAYTKVTFKETAFKNVLSFDYQLYTSPWSQLGGLTFQNCTFDGIIVGAIASQELAFNGCTFNDYVNTTSANNSNPTWIRPAYGNWTKGDNEGQGTGFRSLTKITFENNTVTSTRPVKFERIAQWEMATTVTATGNTFAITPQAGDTSTKNVGLYFGANAKFDLVIENNEKSDGTAALYTAVYSAPTGVTYVGLPAGSTVKNAAGAATSSNDALAWKTNNQITLETTAAVASVAKIGDDEYETLKDAYAAAKDGDVIQLVAGEVDATASGTLSNGASKKVTIRGAGMGETVVNWGNGRIGADAGSDYGFEDLTLVIDHKGAGMPYTDCFWHPKSETFTRVQINGAISTMDPAVFDRCVFNGSTTGDEYLLYQYDSTLEVKNCHFVKAGSKGSIKLYAEAGNALTTVVTDCEFDAVGSKGSAIYTSNSNNAGETTQVVYDITHSGVTVPEGKEVVLASGNGVSVVNAKKDEDGKYVSGLFLSANTNAETVKKIIANVAAENLVAAKEDGKPQWSLAPAKTAVAKIGDDEYETLKDAYAAAKDGDVILLVAGEVDATASGTLSTGASKKVTIRGAGMDKTVVNWGNGRIGADAGSDYVFEDLTLVIDHKGANMPYADCFWHPKSETFTRVAISGAISTMDPAVFDCCVFNGSTTGDEYLLYQYDSTLEVKNCRFVKAGSKGSIKLYAEAGNALTTVVTDCEFDAVGSKGSAIYTSNSNNAGETTQVVYDITHSGVTVPEGKEVVLASGNGVSVVNAKKDEDGKYVSGLFLSANTNAETVEKIIANVAAENLVAAKEDGKPQWSLAPAKTVVAKIGDDEYETLQDAIDAATAGQTVTLLADVNVTEQVEVSEKAISLDLAGHTIAYTGTATLPSGVLLVHNGAGLTINDSSEEKSGKITSGENAYAAVAVTKKGDDATLTATLTVNAGTLTGRYYGISGNGTRHNTAITVNGGTIASTEGTGIYHPQDGKLTVTGGTVTGAENGIELRAGTLNVTGGEISSTAETFAIEGNGNGTSTVGAGIAVSQHTTKKPISVTVTGGTVSGQKSVVVANAQNATADEFDVTVALNGGTFANGLAVSGDISGAMVTKDEAATVGVPEDYKWVENTLVKKVYVASITDGETTTKYETLQAAFDAAKTGDTVTLLSDITLTEQVNITKALDGLTLDGNGKTITCATTDDPFKSGGSALYFGNATDHLYCTGIKIKNLTMTGTARFAIFLCGGTTTEFTNVKISGNYYIAVNLHGTHGATMTNCHISNSTTGTDKYLSAIWSNVASANPLTLNNSTVDVIAINAYTTANTLEPKIYVMGGSEVGEIHTFDDGSVSGNKKLCVSASSTGTYVVKEYDASTQTWVDIRVVVAVTLGGETKAMPFPVAWLETNIGKDASSWTTEELQQPAANGLAKWHCYLFGLDPKKADAKVVATAGQGTEESIPLAVANADASASPLVSGGYVTVAYVLMGSNDRTAWTEVATSDEGDGLAIPLTTGTTYKFYRVDVTVTSAKGN